LLDFVISVIKLVAEITVARFVCVISLKGIVKLKPQVIGLLRLLQRRRLLGLLGLLQKRRLLELLG
jgi:hypothetical protein